MVRKTSKRAGDTHHFTYHERKTAGHGTQTGRVGSDSHLAFGDCALCLHDAVAPMVTASGNIYCRECIMDYMLRKTQELKLQREAFAAQCEEEESRRLEGQLAKRDVEVASFARTQDVGGAGGKGGAEPGSRQAVIAHLSKRVDESTRDAKRQRMLETSPWIVDNTPAGLKEKIAEPPARPPSPMSGQPLRVKELVAAVLNREDDGQSQRRPTTATATTAAAAAAAAAGEGDEGDEVGSGAAASASVSAPAADSNRRDGPPRGKVICAVTRREISSQPAVCIKKSGQVMLEDVAKQFAYPTMTCPISGNKFKMKDVIKLRRSGTAFAASGQSVATVYKPTMT